MTLSNKIALITSSATGTGEAIARRFAQQGARVVIHGRLAPKRSRRQRPSVRTA